MHPFILALLLLSIFAGGLNARDSRVSLRRKVFRCFPIALTLYLVVLFWNEGLPRFHSIDYALEASVYHVLPFVTCFLVPNLGATVMVAFILSKRKTPEI